MTATSLGATLATCSDPTVLVPGSAGPLRGDADLLDQQSRALAQQATDLRDAHPSTWTGDAADGWAGRREQFAQTLGAVSQIHSTAGAALLLHAQTLEWGQGAAGSAVRLYERGCALRDAELGPSGALLAGRGAAATDSGAGLRNLAERTLSAAQTEVSASARAAAAVLDELSAGLPDGRWHLGEFAQGMWSWVTGITDMLVKFNSLRLLVDRDGVLRDGAATWQEGVDMYESLTADPLGTSEQLAQLDLLRDRPAQWWGQLAPDIALTAAGGAGAATRALRGFSAAEEIAAGGRAAASTGGLAERLHWTIPDPAYRAIEPDWGVSFFSRDIVQFYSGSEARLGSGRGAFFHMTAEDAMQLQTPHDVLRGTGFAPSIEDAVILRPAPDGPEVYGIAFPREGLSPRVPELADSAGHPHYLEGGHTALKIDDAPGHPGTGGYLVNPTREYVLDGAPPVPDGSLLFQLGPDGTWLPLRRFP